MAPDNTQFLSYMAAVTNRIGLLTGAVILPWNNPLRVVEKMILLDHLSKGRAMFGIGRGLAKREYDGFGIDMNEARDRFDEAAEMIIRGLETGIVEGDGKYYKQMRTEVRPRPYASFKDRFYCVAMSSDSVPVCARLGRHDDELRAEAVGADGRPLQHLPQPVRAASATAPPRRRSASTSCAAARAPRRPSRSPASTCRTTT